MSDHLTASLVFSGPGCRTTSRVERCVSMVYNFSTAADEFIFGELELSYHTFSIMHSSGGNGVDQLWEVFVQSLIIA